MRVALSVAVLLIVGCAAQRYAIYQPPGEDRAWVIKIEKRGIEHEFHVIINDSLIIKRAAQAWTGDLEAEGEYAGRPIKLVVKYSYGFLGSGAGFEAILYIAGNPAAVTRF